MEDKSGAMDRLGFNEGRLIRFLQEQGIPRQQQTEIYRHTIQIAVGYADLRDLCSTDEERKLARKNLDLLSV